MPDVVLEQAVPASFEAKMCNAAIELDLRRRHVWRAINLQIFVKLAQ